MKLIEMKQIKKDYPLGDTKVRALKGVDFSVDEGDFLSVVGPSGSGKTTLLNIIGCVDTPTNGSYELHDERVFDYKDERDEAGLSDDKLTEIRLFKVGFIFQTFNLIPVLNIIENVEFPLLLMGNTLSKDDIRERAEHFIKAVELEEYALHRPSELSGGQRQRVAIARALVTRPDIVLADEPTANLDSVTGNKILTLMQRLNEEEKTTFIFSTHDPEVLKYAKRIVKIRDGLIEQN